MFLIAGPPAVGKSSTSRALAARFPRCLYIPVDDIRMYERYRQTRTS
jgi:tRNA A37 N6-isopentenylltransferase MiaA